MNVFLRAAIGVAVLTPLSSGAAAAQDFVIGERSYPTVEEALQNLPPVPAWCEGAVDGEACVPAMIAESGPTSEMWRPVWAKFDDTYCADEATVSWQVRCEVPDAVRLFDGIGIRMLRPGLPDTVVRPARPPWREGEAPS